MHSMTETPCMTMPMVGSAPARADEISNDALPTALPDTCRVTCTVCPSGVVCVALCVVAHSPSHSPSQQPSQAHEITVVEQTPPGAGCPPDDHDDDAMMVPAPAADAMCRLEQAPGTAEDYDRMDVNEAAAEAAAEAEAGEWALELLDAPRIFQPLPVVVYVPPPQNLSPSTVSFVTARRLEQAPGSADEHMAAVEVEVEGGGMVAYDADSDSPYCSQATLTQPTPTVAALLLSPPSSLAAEAGSSPSLSVSDDEHVEQVEHVEHVEEVEEVEEAGSACTAAAPTQQSCVRMFVPPALALRAPLPGAAGTAADGNEAPADAVDGGQSCTADDSGEAARLKKALAEQVTHKSPGVSHTC
jgi:hypothetical protein